MQKELKNSASVQILSLVNILTQLQQYEIIACLSFFFLIIKRPLVIKKSLYKKEPFAYKPLDMNERKKVNSLKLMEQGHFNVIEIINYVIIKYKKSL